MSQDNNTVAEAYWRAKIADEIKKAMMPLCVCQRCDNLFEGRLVEDAIKVALGGKR